MKICPKCGNELFDDSVICTRCGSAQQIIKPQPTKDCMNIFWFIISFLVWWVGILLFIYFRKDDPHKAKICLAGTISVFAFAAAVGMIALTISILGTIFSL